MILPPNLSSRTFKDCKPGDFVFLGAQQNSTGQQMNQYGLCCEIGTDDKRLMILMSGAPPTVVKASDTKRCLLIESVEILVRHKKAILSKAEPYRRSGTLTVLEHQWLIWAYIPPDMHSNLDDEEPFDLETGSFVPNLSDDKGIANFSEWSIILRDPHTKNIETLYER